MSADQSDLRRAELRENLERVYERIERACARAGRPRSDVRLIAVSKRKPARDVRLAYELGQRAFGENYVQELTNKSAQLSDLPDIEWHMIGHLQRNKAKQLVPIARAIHTVDDARLAAALDTRAGAAGIQLEVFIEVNVAAESQKAGCAPSAVGELASAIRALPHLHLLGLMAIPPASDDPERSRPHFALLRELAARDPIGLPRLSMGMSADFELAIEEGATDIRVGTTIFGDRDEPR